MRENRNKTPRLEYTPFRQVFDDLISSDLPRLTMSQQYSITHLELSKLTSVACQVAIVLFAMQGSLALAQSRSSAKPAMPKSMESAEEDSSLNSSTWGSKNKINDTTHLNRRLGKEWLLGGTVNSPPFALSVFVERHFNPYISGYGQLGVNIALGGTQEIGVGVYALPQHKWTPVFRPSVNRMGLGLVKDVLDSAFQSVLDNPSVELLPSHIYTASFSLGAEYRSDRGMTLELGVQGFVPIAPTEVKRNFVFIPFYFRIGGKI
jgi:hypothetical protein